MDVRVYCCPHNCMGGYARAKYTITNALFAVDGVDGEQRKEHKQQQQQNSEIILHILHT